MHADADAAIRHDLQKSRPRHAAGAKIDEHLKHMPAMPRVAASRQHHARITVELLEVACGQRAAARVESIQAAQLADADLRGNIGEIALRPRKHHIQFSGGIALDAVESILLEQFRGLGVAGGDGAAFDAGHVLVRMEAEYDQIAEAADGLAGEA